MKTGINLLILSLRRQTGTHFCTFASFCNRLANSCRLRQSVEQIDLHRHMAPAIQSRAVDKSQAVRGREECLGLENPKRLGLECTSVQVDVGQVL